MNGGESGSKNIKRNLQGYSLWVGGRKPENCVTFLSPKGIKRTVSRDLLKIFEFCKMFWTANNACDIAN